MNLGQLQSRLKTELIEKRISFKIKTIFVYGSSARGTMDEYSDVDILVVAKNLDDKHITLLKDILEGIFDNKDIDISIYDINKFQTLLTSGSLFLHHIKLEGEILYTLHGYSKENIFRKLNDFKGITEDLLLYQRMNSKAAKSIEGKGINYYDLNILGLLVRNTLILICYLLNEPTFGKHEVYKKCEDLINDKFELEKNVYEELLLYREYFNRKSHKIELPPMNRYNNYIYSLDCVINLALNLSNVRDTIDRVYFILKDNVGRNLYTSFEVFTDLDRDIYFYLKKYMKGKYNFELDSIRGPFIKVIYVEYAEDDFITSIYNLIEEMKKIKEKSSNYSIQTPDIYAEVHVDKYNDNIIETSKILSFIKEIYFRRFKIKQTENILELLEEVREMIKEEDLY